MDTSGVISKLGPRMLLLQGALTLVAVPAAALKLSMLFGWSLLFALLAGATSFAAGITASVVTRSIKWLWLSAAAVLVTCVTLLVGLTNMAFGV